MSDPVPCTGNPDQPWLIDWSKVTADLPAAKFSTRDDCLQIDWTRIRATIVQEQTDD